MLLQALVQGLLQGVGTMLAYSRMVAILGVSRAVLFPAMVPAASILVGVPLVGEITDGPQLAGLALASLGLLVAVGILRPLFVARPKAAPAA